MKAKDLRIGNYISSMYEEEVSVIKSIVEGENRGGHFVVTENNKTSITMIKPTSLTEEWLLKFGYIKIGSNYIIQGHSIWVCNDLLMCDKNGIVLKSVPQLQNLYFALTGLELEIK